MRFPTPGCYPLAGPLTGPLTGAVDSAAATVAEIIEEPCQARPSGRQDRASDCGQAESTKSKKQEAYL